MSDAGAFLIEKARERRVHFFKRRGWMLLAFLPYPALVVTAVALISRNPLADWVTRRELAAFWIGVGIVGTAWWIAAMLGLDGGRNLRQGAQAEKWTAAALRRLRRRGWSLSEDVNLFETGWSRIH